MIDRSPELSIHGILGEVVKGAYIDGQGAVQLTPQGERAIRVLRQALGSSPLGDQAAGLLVSLTLHRDVLGPALFTECFGGSRWGGNRLQFPNPR